MENPVKKGQFINCSVFVLLICFFLSDILIIKTGETAVTGKLSGVVKEGQTGKTLVNARIVLVGTPRSTLTNQNGVYVFLGLHPDKYDIEIDLNGYRSMIKEGIQIDVGLTTTVDFWLEVASIESQPMVIKTGKSGIRDGLGQSGKLIKTSEIWKIPYHTVDEIIVAKSVGTTIDQANRSIHFRGGRSTGMAYMLDGLPITDPIFKGIGMYVHPRTLEQIELITGGWDAEYGDAHSGIVNLISREGQKKFTGKLVYRYGMWSRHDDIQPFFVSWQDPDDNYRPHSLELFEGVFLGEPYPYQMPYRGNHKTISEYEAESIDSSVYTPILPGVWADRTKNPEFSLTDPATGELILDATGDRIMEHRPYETKDGNHIDYVAKKVALSDGYEIDLRQYSDLLKQDHQGKSEINGYNLDGTHLGEFFLSGPVYGYNTFAISGQRQRYQGDLPGSFTRQSGIQGNLKFLLTTDIFLKTSAVFDTSRSEFPRSKYRFNPSMNPTRYNNGLNIGVLLSHHLGLATMYNIRLGYFRNTYQEKQDERSWDPFTKAFDRNTWNLDLTHKENIEQGKIHAPVPAYNDPNYYIAGDHNEWKYRQSFVFTVKVDLVRQLNRYHLLKLGSQYVGTKMQVFETVVYSESDLRVDYYDTQPSQISGYVQDKVEYAEFVVDVGLRFDVYRLDSQYPSDWEDPFEVSEDGRIKYNAVELDPDFMKFVYRDTLDGLVNQEAFLAEQRLSFFPRKKNPIKPMAKSVLSPRFRISYPIEEYGKVHFSYGHYSQIPPGYNLYQDSEFDLRARIRQVGNPNLVPEKTIASEVGITRQLIDDTVFGVTCFMKNMDNLTDVRFIDIGQYSYYHFVSTAYARSRGVEFVLQKLESEFNRFSGMLTYSYSMAKGSKSYWDVEYLGHESGTAEYRSLNWDQRHRFSILFNIKFPFDIDVDGVGRWASGLPYPDASPNHWLYNNPKRYPSTYNVDVILSWKMNLLLDIPMSLFLDIRNLFNTKNLYDVLDVEMYEIYGRPMDSNRRTTPQAWSPPRQVVLGLMVDW